MLPHSLPMAGNAPLLPHVVAELEAWADGEADGVAAVLQQVGEQMIVYQVGLHDQAEMFSDVERDAAAESVERGPFFLLAGRGHFVHQDLGNVIGGTRRSNFVNDSAGRPDIRSEEHTSELQSLRHLV